MFRGQYEHTVDAKGRLALPSAFRRTLAERGDGQLVVTKHLSTNCLVAYPQEEWRTFESRLAALPQFDANVMVIRRLYVGGAMDCSIDKQGRVLVPPVLREMVGLEREVFWVGNLATIEIWAKDAWLNYRAGDDIDASAAAAKLGELGL